MVHNQYKGNKIITNIAKALHLALMVSYKQGIKMISCPDEDGVELLH